METLGMILKCFFFPSKKGAFTEVMIMRRKDWKKMSFRHVDFELLVKFPSRDG